MAKDEKTASWKRAWRAKRVAEGRCVECGDPAVQCRTYCKACLEKRREYYRLWMRNKRKKDKLKSQGGM